MSSPNYADHAWYGQVLLERNERLACDTYRLRFVCPAIARRVVPGQFIMLRLPNCNDPLLGRPLAIYDLAADEAGKPCFLDVVYVVVGKMTRLLAELPRGARLEAWGPLGNGFPPQPAEHLLMVAGGIGQTPFLMLAREHLGLATYGEPPRAVPLVRRATLCYGVRKAEYLACVDDFRSIGVEVLLSTDDGSAGHSGLVTELIAPAVREMDCSCRIVCCGPEAMMAETARIARQLGVPCQMSLESPMACGIGACFSCVKRVRDAEGRWDYRRTCIEGPVFDAEDVEL
jgi:dihydroorotate dehydrogenase electron transfer subunit